MASAAAPAPAPGYSIRAVTTDADLAAMAAIYAHFTRASTAPWASAEEVSTAADFAARWRAAAPRGLPWLVAVDAAGAVAGYCTVGDFRGRLGWRFACEHSVYVAPAHARRGLGRALLAAAIAGARAAGVAVLVAVISVHAPSGAGAASVALHEALGCTRAGAFPAAGVKGGLVLDAVFLALTLQPIPESAVADPRGALVAE